MAPPQQLQSLEEFFQQARAVMPDDAHPIVRRAIADQTWQVGAEPTDVTYEEVSIADIPCIWSKPLSATKGKVCLYIHGGGFFLASARSGHRKMIAHLAKACNLQTIAPEYRQTPDYTYPTAHDDCMSIYKHLLDQGYSGNDIVLAGDSAGGGVIIALALAAVQQGLTKPAACVCISPWVDLACESPSFQTNTKNDVLNTPESVGLMAHLYLNGTGVDLKDPRVNVLYADLSGLPPTWISVAAFDSLADDGRRLAEKAKKEGADVVLEVHEGQQHVFEFTAGKNAEADKSMRDIGSWVKKRIGN